MSKDDVPTKVRPGGLRYESKAGGTDFPGPFGATMSCLRCGKHIAPARLSFAALRVGKGAMGHVLSPVGFEWSSSCLDRLARPVPRARDVS